MATGRGLVLLFILLAGCFGPAGTDTTTSTTEAPTERPGPPASTFELPPCTLKPGRYLLPDAPGAPRPAPASAPRHAEVVVTKDGTAHIYADDAYTLFHANGYAQARDRLFQMDLLRAIAWGYSATIIGEGQLASDFRVARDLYTYEELESQWQNTSVHMREVVQAFTDGVNRYIDEAMARPTLLPGEYVLLDRPPEAWKPLDTVVIVAYLFGTYGAEGGQELTNAERMARLRQTLGDGPGYEAFDDLAWARAMDTYPTIPPSDLVSNGCEDVTHAAPDSLQTQYAMHAIGKVEDSLPGDGEAIPGPQVPPLPAPPLAATQAPPSPAATPSDPPLTPRPAATAAHGANPGMAAASGADPELGAMAGFQFGSMAILVDAEHSATGKPMLVGGPQLGYHKPPIPYMVGLHAPGWDVAGIGLTGVPGVLWGRNPDFAWTVTAGKDDQVDVVAVPTHVEGNDPDTYLWDGEARRMECDDSLQHHTRATLAELLDQGPGQAGLPQFYEQKVCRVEGMPVVARTGPEADAQLAWAKRTAYRGKELDAAWMWLNVGRQPDLEHARAMLASFPMSMNFHFADHERIAFLHTGAVPIRAPGFDHRLPVPGGAESQWRGIAYTSDLGLWVEGSSTGYLVNWNNAPALGWRTGDTPQKWGSVHRAEVLDAAVRARLEASGGKLTFLDVLAIEREVATRDAFAGHFVPELIAAARSHSGMGAMADELQAWLDAGVPWRHGEQDGEHVYDDPAHAIYDRAITELVRRLTSDELLDLTPVLRLDPREDGTNNKHTGDHGRGEAEYSMMYDAIRGRTRHDWCDDNSTPAHESCQENLVSALRLAQTTLTRDQGADTTRWRQSVHRSDFVVMGLHEPDSIPMVNRGTWVQAVALGEGLDGAAVSMPPSNAGFVAMHELTLNTAPGEFTEPPRLREGLADYVAFQFDRFPLARDEVTAEARNGAGYGLDVLPVPLPAPDIPV